MLVARPFDSNITRFLIENTPNPQCMKFLPGQDVLPPEFGTGVSFQRSNRQGFQRSRLAMSIFDIEGVDGTLMVI